MKGKIRALLCVSSMIAATVALNTSYADNSKPQFDCTLTDQVSADNQPGDAKATFTKVTPTIHLLCNTADVTKGQSVKAQWIAADTNNVAPANYKIDEKSMEVPKTPADDQQFTADFSLSKPNNGWPAGSYHVDLFLDNQLVQSYKFTVG